MQWGGKKFADRIQPLTAKEGLSLSESMLFCFAKFYVEKHGLKLFNFP